MEEHGRLVDLLKEIRSPIADFLKTRPMEANTAADAPADEALEIARHYAFRESEKDTRLGIVSRALVERMENHICGVLDVTDDEKPERWGLLVRPSHWLEDTCAVQRNAYNLEPEGVAYVKEQATAAIVELAEMLQELPWKSARDGTPGREATPDEMGKARKELLDALTFLGNIAVALEFTDDELWVEMNQLAVRNVSKRAGLGKDYWPEAPVPCYVEGCEEARAHRHDLGQLVLMRQT